jgi:dolichol-phosphate mannosyltransferase
MDCDLQHPVDFIPDFIEKLEDDPDIVIGSRYMPGGYNSWPAYRGFVSRTATFLSHALISSSRKVKDPLSGYFLIKRDMISKLKPYTGMYKPLLFAVAVSGNPRMVEIPIRMEERDAGESKIVTNPVKVVVKYLREILVFFKYTHQ